MKYVVTTRRTPKETEVLDAEKYGHTYKKFIGNCSQMIYSFPNGVEASLTIFKGGYPGSEDTKFEIGGPAGIHRFKSKRDLYKHLRNLSLIEKEDLADGQQNDLA
jgi:hypothetical protein